MIIEILPDPDAVAKTAANLIAAEARTAVTERGRFVMAVSGGKTPWQMLRALANEQVPWAGVHIVQVDERVAPAGDPDRNLTHLRESLLSHAPLPESADLRDAGGGGRFGGGSGGLRADAATNRRHAAGAGLGSSWARRRRPYGFACSR